MQVVGSPLHAGQQRVVDFILQGYKYVVVNASRQIGKSFLAQQVLCYWALNHPNSVILVAAPTYSQLRRPFEELVDGLSGSNLIADVNKSEFRIKFVNGSKILFKSTERPDTMRGLTADFAVLDEAAYMNESAWNAVIKPILLVKGRQVLFISTPKGKNYFYDLYQLGQSDDHKDWISTTMTYDENPFVDQQEIESARATLPTHIFNAEYLAQFEDSGDTVFQNLDAASFSVWPKPSGKIFAGLDLGKQNDFTVLTIMDETGQVLDIYRDNQKDWSFMVNEIMARLKRWSPELLIEVNSIGDVVFELIKKQWPRTKPFTTTSNSKQNIIENLIMDFNKSVVKIPSQDLFKPLRFELDIFSYHYSPKSRSIQYSAPQGHHDDCVMSLAIANQCRKSQINRGQYVVGGIKL
jgi:hypothetical protein